MITRLFQLCLFALGLLVVFSFAVSQFYCGDAGCLNGNSDENCASLLCSLLNKHEAASQHAASGANKDCSCVCHWPAVMTPVFIFAYHPTIHNHIFASSLFVHSIPNRLVYHPPAAA